MLQQAIAHACLLGAQLVSLWACVFLSACGHWGVHGRHCVQHVLCRRSSKPGAPAHIISSGYVHNARTQKQFAKTCVHTVSCLRCAL